MRSSTIPANVHGAPCWVDLSSPDPIVVSDFYAGLLGWTVGAAIGALGAQLVAGRGSRPVGSSRLDPTRVRPSGWLVWFTVNDVEATLATVDSVGGGVVQEPTELGDDASIGLAIDPAGAWFGVIGGGRAPRAPYLSLDVGSVGWVELRTTEPARTAAFYERVFHWHIEGDGGHRWFLVRRGNGRRSPQPRRSAHLDLALAGDLHGRRLQSAVARLRDRWRPHRASRDPRRSVPRGRPRRPPGHRVPRRRVPKRQLARRHHERSLSDSLSHHPTAHDDGDATN